MQHCPGSSVALPRRSVALQSGTVRQTMTVDCFKCVADGSALQSASWMRTARDDFPKVARARKLAMNFRTSDAVVLRLRGAQSCSVFNVTIKHNSSLFQSTACAVATGVLGSLSCASGMQSTLPGKLTGTEGSFESDPT
jgi:hypothetical protein